MLTDYYVMINVSHKLLIGNEFCYCQKIKDVSTKKEITCLYKEKGVIYLNFLGKKVITKFQRTVIAFGCGYAEAQIERKLFPRTNN